MHEELLNLKFYKGEDLYNDGDVEEEILSICESGQDIPALLRESDSWPLLYHLSDIRHNLLEWYDFAPKGTLLEIGAGCGAVTGLFCDRLKRVVGIDLSKRRSTINVTRNGGKGNLEVLVGNFEDIRIEEKFDYVTLIGVLEYSGYYISTGDNPYATMLKRAKEYLKPGGRLIIAIENKFGLKYFGGAAEDHTGGFFDGIENYSSVKGVYTFSKPELTRLLQGTGFKEQQFYYPMPDYKLPDTVYSDAFLPKPGMLTHVSDAYDRERYHMFDESAAYDAIIRDGQFPYFANSFLVIAGEER